MPRNMNLHFVNSTEAWIYFTYKTRTGTFNNSGALIHDFIETSVTPNGERRYGKHPTQKPESLIQHFVEILSNENEMVLLKIFNPNIKKPRIGNKKDFYLTWMILKDLDIQIIKTYRDEILKDLERIFKTMKHVPNGMTVDDFKEEMNNMINKYSRY